VEGSLLSRADVTETMICGDSAGFGVARGVGFGVALAEGAVGFGVGRVEAGDFFGAIPLGVAFTVFFGVGVPLVDRIDCAPPGTPNIPNKAKADRQTKTNTFLRKFVILFILTD
jgi:hypothetical protein